MKKVSKGHFGYISFEKKKRSLMTAILFAIPLIIYITGLLQTGTRKNLFTFVAIMGCLPASKCAVGMVLVLLQKPMERSLYEECQAHVRDLTVIYDGVVSSEKRNTRIPCIVVSGLHVVGYSDDPKLDAAATELHIKKILQGNSYRANVKIFSDKKAFLRRVDELWAHREADHANLNFKPDERYPDATRDELVQHIIMAICV
ncbi:MAG: hypothetical protein Q4B57_05700 [Eubacteriales bacterium]|nr:hypothetical protein [Eubacteriales bacterium]